MAQHRVWARDDATRRLKSLASSTHTPSLASSKVQDPSHNSLFLFFFQITKLAVFLPQPAVFLLAVILPLLSFLPLRPVLPTLCLIHEAPQRLPLLRAKPNKSARPRQPNSSALSKISSLTRSTHSTRASMLWKTDYKTTPPRAEHLSLPQTAPLR